MENVALRKPYTKSHTPYQSYPDDGNAEFTDGKTTQDTSSAFVYRLYELTGSTGVGTGYVNIDIDLGEVFSVKHFVLHSGGGSTSYIATSVEIHTSTDSMTWALQGATDTPVNTWEHHVTLASPVDARYARFRIRKDFGYISPKYLFIVEGQVFSAADEPEAVEILEADTQLELGTEEAVSGDSALTLFATETIEAATVLTLHVTELVETDARASAFMWESRVADVRHTVYRQERVEADAPAAAYANEVAQADIEITVYAEESIGPDLSLQVHNEEQTAGDSRLRIYVRETLEPDRSLSIYAFDRVQADARITVTVVETEVLDADASILIGVPESVRPDARLQFFGLLMVQADARTAVYLPDKTEAAIRIQVAQPEAMDVDARVMAFAGETIWADARVSILIFEHEDLRADALFTVAVSETWSADLRILVRQSLYTGDTITQAIFHALSHDLGLAGLLAQYGGAPAVFTAEPIPPSASLPFVAVSPSFAGTPMDTKTTRGRETRRDIRVYAKATGSAVEVERIAEAVRKVLHRSRLETADSRSWAVRVHGPVEAPTDGSVYGRVLTLVLSMERTTAPAEIEAVPAAGLTEALYKRLAADGVLASMVSQYQGAPAVFSVTPVPKKATPPYVVIAPAGRDDPHDTKTGSGREVEREVRVYAPAQGSVLGVEAMAERVTDLLHRQPLSVEGHEVSQVEVRGPYVVPDGGDAAYGLAVNVRLALRRKGS